MRDAGLGGDKPLYRFRSPVMLEVERLMVKLAPTDSPVLITGESGTGKGVLARAVHAMSDRHELPFLSVNCSAMPDLLTETEFLGHPGGAPTGFDGPPKGLFVAADGGTLFLDDVGGLSLHMQTRLLDVIEDKEVRPIGSEHARRVDVRVIAATNLNLAESVTRGSFREDLFFRLSAFHLSIPPLRERRTEIRGLIHHFLDGDGAGSRTAAAHAIDPEAEDLLLAYDWPGNVRELENVISHAQILAEGDCITVADLPAELTAAHPSDGKGNGTEGRLRDQVRKFEAALIAKTIEDAGGDRKLAAQRLGIALSSLYRKLEELGSDA